MKYGVIIHWSNEDGAFVADVPELPGCSAHGPTQEIALRNAQDAAELWLETARSPIDIRVSEFTAMNPAKHNLQYCQLETQRHGKDCAEVLDEVLADRFEDETRDYQEAVEGIRRGFSDLKSGRVQPADGVFERLRAKHAIPVITTIAQNL